MGIITMALVSHGYLQEMAVPHWVQILCALAMCLGTSVGGWIFFRQKLRPCAFAGIFLLICGVVLLHL